MVSRGGKSLVLALKSNLHGLAKKAKKGRDEKLMFLLTETPHGATLAAPQHYIQPPYFIFTSPVNTSIPVNQYYIG